MAHCPSTLPDDLWIKILTMLAEQERMDWYDKLPEIEREHPLVFDRWDITDRDLAELHFESIFEL